MTIRREALDTLRGKRAALDAGGGADKIEARRAKGLLSARDRLDLLFQPGTFQEFGAYVQHRAQQFGLAGKDLPADGVITGTGYVRDMQVAAFSQDFTVAAGTLGRMHARKIVRLMRFALKNGLPLVAFKDSGGARIQEGVDALSGYGDVFYANVLLSGVVPQIAVVLGPCAGGAAYSPALMDFVIMTRNNAHMFITGPEVIKAVTGRSDTMDEVGGAEMHATVSGNVHFVAEDDRHAIALVQALLSYLPANNTEDPPHDPGSRPSTRNRTRRSTALMPDEPLRAAGHVCGASGAWWTRASCWRCTPALRATSSSASRASAVSWSAWSPTSRWSWPARWTSTPPTRRRASSASATSSTCRW